ncbi:MAG TPA: hypothetical protein VE442_09305 [Jatrophihabitans sp.]|nr:hypothetical protein [Jatrophihabitans sp.]
MIAGVAAISLTASAAAGSAPVTGAAFTTVNESVDGTGHCQNGNPNVNCNIYDGKQYVWLNGGPSVAYVGDGSYFFAVLDPGGQADPNDGATKNLSDDYDAYTNRTFNVSGGTVSYGGSHDFTSNKVRLMPYADTSNPGGVYIMAICSLADGYPVNASDCKYDAFKVQEGEVTPGLPLTITKDANGAYDNTYTWTITKDVDKTIVKQVGGSANFNYTVTVTHDGGTISNVRVTGTISVFNPNVDGSNSTVPVDIDGVTDQLSDGTVCAVTNGGAQTLTQAKTDFAYTCDLSGLPQGELDNTASVAWSQQFLDNGSLLEDNSADFTFENISFAENAIDECANVSDSYAGTLGTVCVGDSNPKTFTYQRTIPVPANDCVSYDNTGTFTTNDSGATGSASQRVTVCGPAKTGALTIGFWKNTNGQNLITTYCQNPALANYLKGLGGGTGPFANAPTTSCKDLASYVSGILSGASATDMNKMLKAQMLGTALDVWFSGSGWTSTTISKVKPPSNFLSHNSLGGFKMDTTAVCPMVDNTTTGTATCKNNTPSTDAVASSAVPSSPMSMQAILDFAATTPAPFNGSTASSVWYGGNRTLQEILKNVFDQFNNQYAFGSF